MSAKPPSLQQWLGVRVAWCYRDLGPGESQWMPDCFPRALSHLDTFPWQLREALFTGALGS